MSAIIDTGSDTLAFPCQKCPTANCGKHQFNRFNTKKSQTFDYEINCQDRFLYENKNVCSFIKTYAEGSTMMGFLSDDFIKFKNTHHVIDPRLAEFNSFLKKDL